MFMPTLRDELGLDFSKCGKKGASHVLLINGEQDFFLFTDDPKGLYGVHYFTKISA